jgi:hypothetical protein
VYNLLSNGSLVLSTNDSTPPTKMDGVEAGRPHNMTSRNIALGVGLGVAVPAIALAGFLVWRMTRKVQLPPPKVFVEEDA